MDGSMKAQTMVVYRSNIPIILYTYTLCGQDQFLFTGTPSLSHYNLTAKWVGARSLVGHWKAHLGQPHPAPWARLESFDLSPYYWNHL